MSQDLTLYEDDQNLLDRCICKMSKDGKTKFIDPEKSVNYCTILQYHWAFRDMFAFDEFELQPKIVRCPDWYTKEEKSRFRVRPVSNEDIIRTDYQMQRLGMNGSTGKVQDAIYVAARQYPMHPVRDYFNRIQWDGTNRLDKWLQYYLGAEFDDQEYLSAVGRKWLVAAVARVMDPGCKFDNMLIFEGNQGKGKSTALRVLATFDDGDKKVEYFTDEFSISKADDKDELMKLAGRLIVEIAELDGFYKREDTFMKAFISRQTDQFRPPFGRVSETYKRQFVFAGTYNPKAGVFRDPTGARRYWPLKVGKIDLQALRHDREQLWAEAVMRYREGEQLFLSEELEKKAAEATNARRIRDNWEEDVMEAAGSAAFVQVRDIMKDMKLEINQRGGREAERIADILRSRGWVYDRRRINGRQKWGWAAPTETIRVSDEEPPMMEPVNEVPVLQFEDEPEAEPQYDYVNNF